LETFDRQRGKELPQGNHSNFDVDNQDSAEQAKRAEKV
jgi:hypothetical protein